MRLAALAVDLHLPALAGLLCLRARAIEARDVEPDIEANGRLQLRSSLTTFIIDAMLGIDTLNEWFALIGCVFVVWLL